MLVAFVMLVTVVLIVLYKNAHLVLILWMVMVVSPTPGGSGISEYAFKEYYSDIFYSTSAIIFVTLVWRIISYYLYLVLGLIIIPNWIKKSFSKTDPDTPTGSGD